MMAGSALTQLVAAGEIFASPSQFYSATNVAAKRGAPVAWVPMGLVVTNAGGAAVRSATQVCGPPQGTDSLPATGEARSSVNNATILPRSMTDRVSECRRLH